MSADTGGMGAARATPSANAPEKLSYRLDEAVKATGLSRSKLYDLIAKGELVTFKFGRCTMIRADVLKAMVDRASGRAPQLDNAAAA